jgi:hypothetical protein
MLKLKLVFYNFVSPITLKDINDEKNNSNFNSIIHGLPTIRLLTEHSKK